MQETTEPRRRLRRALVGGVAIAGVMLESHLHDGSQPLAHPLRYGVSITDACLGWGQTEDLIGELIETP